MPAERKFPKSGRRQIVDYNRFASRKGEYVLTCINRSVLDVARLLLAGRGLWASTYAVAYGDNSYTPVDDVQLGIVEELVAEFMEATSEMNCDTFLAEISRIADAMERSADANENCCGTGSGGAGGEPEQPSAFEDDGGTTFPSGYADRAEYEATKCQQAEQVRLDMISDIEWIKTADIASLTATGLALGLVLAISGAGLVLIAGFAVSLVAQGLLVGVCDEILAYLAAEAADIRCRLFNATDAEDAQAAISDGSLSTLAETFLDLFMAVDTFNPLFEHSPNQGDHGVSCAGCVCEWIVDFGSGTPTTDNVQFVISSEETAPGVHNAGMQLIPNCCGPDYDVHVDVNSAGSKNGAICEQCPNLNDLVGSNLAVGTYSTVGGQVKQTSTSGPFTLTLRIEEV